MKSLISLSLFATLAVGCGHKNDPFQVPAAHAEAQQKFCANPIVIAAQPGESVVQGSFTSVGGRWKLESMRTYMKTTDADGGDGYLVGELVDGRAKVNCHNSYKDGNNHLNLKSSLGLPGEIDSDNGVYSLETTLSLEAFEGRTSASSESVSVYKSMPRGSNTPFPGVDAILVKTPQGKLVLRFTYSLRLGAGSQTYGAEATYKPAR